MELIVKKKRHGFFDSNYKVLDVNGNLYWMSMEIYVSKLMVVSEISRRRVMCDAYGFRLLTMGRTEGKHVNV